MSDPQSPALVEFDSHPESILGDTHFHEILDRAGGNSSRCRVQARQRTGTFAPPVARCFSEQSFRLSRAGYTFLHNQFLEFLAGQGLAADPEFGAHVAAGIRNVDAWREVIKYAAGRKLSQERITGPKDYELVFQTPNHPRVGVSWYEATLIRLPHEAEWEQAARWNGQMRQADPRRFPWGDLDEAAVLAQVCNCSDTGLNHTSAVGLFSGGHAECGATDLSGNVWEWCENWYNEKDETSRVVRGGSWIHDSPERLGASWRRLVRPGYRHYGYGFRAVVVCG